MLLMLVRHGETQWNVDRRIQGAGSDVELNHTGKRQAECLGRALQKQGITAVYSSPLLRARLTAQAIAESYGMTVRLEPALVEIDAGEFESRTVDSIGGALSRFLLSNSIGEMPRLPGGEGLEDLARRAWAAVEGIIRDNPSGKVVVVSHYYTTLTIICRALGLPLSTLRRLRTLPGSISILNMGKRGASLVVLNDTCHLDGLQ